MKERQLYEVKARITYQNRTYNGVYVQYVNRRFYVRATSEKEARKLAEAELRDDPLVWKYSVLEVKPWYESEKTAK